MRRRGRGLEVFQHRLPGMERKPQTARITGRRNRHVFPTTGEQMVGRVRWRNLEYMARIGKAVLGGDVDWRDSQTVGDLIERVTGKRRLL